MRCIAIAIALCLSLPSSTPAQTPDHRIVYLQPMGNTLRADDVKTAVEALIAQYHVEVKTLERVNMPAIAYYSPRHRYRAELLLQFLKTRLPGEGFRIIGLTGDDISTSKGSDPDWGILGLASFHEPVCVVSVFRCRFGQASAELRRSRLRKVAVHELGHTLGLEHCAHRSCLMADARGSLYTVDQERDLCPSCRTALDLDPAPVAVRIESGMAGQSQ